MKNVSFLILIFILNCGIFSHLNAQELLFSEDFNNCTLDDSWELSITNGHNIGFAVGLPTNENSDSLSIDGTCMAIFDDDVVGDNMPTFVATLKTPLINTKSYKTLLLNTDVTFRSIDNSLFGIYIEETDGTRIPLRIFTDGSATGTQFREFVSYSVDLAFFTDSEEIRIVYEYDDNNIWGWYAGIDNISLIGSGAGEVVLSERFNDCIVPQGWTTNILQGEVDWQFGEIENDNASSTTMDGSCFVFFDDDGLGNEAPFSTVDLISPVFDGTSYANFTVNMDLIFRRFGDFENVSILVRDENGDTEIVREFTEAVAGEQFNNFENISADLSAFRSPSMQVVIRYEDGNEWGWWVGVDNFKIIGSGQINDLCANAVALNIGENCSPIDNSNAIFSGPVASCNESQKGALWYSLTSAQDGIIVLRNESNFNDQITVFEGSCGTLNEVHCTNRDEHGFDGEQIFIPATSNQNFLIRVSSNISMFGETAGNSCLSADYVPSTPQAKDEDVIQNAISLTLGDDCVGSQNIEANIESLLPNENDLTRSDVWFTFENEEVENIEFKIETEFAEIATVYNEAMEELTSFPYGGNFIARDLPQNETYFLQIGGVFSNLEGNVCIAALPYLEEPAVADDCLQSLSLDLEEEFVFDNMSQQFSGIYPECDIYPGADIWFSFSTTNNNQLFLNLDTDFTNGAAVYEGICSDLEAVWCQTENSICSGGVEISGLETNKQYYLQVFTTLTNNPLTLGAGNIQISDSSVNEAPITLTVIPICNENSTANLDIIVTGSDDYTLTGNTSVDILEESQEYIVIATDANGCVASQRGFVACQPNDCELTVRATSSPSNCAEENNGLISLEVMNGLAPFIYEWSNTSENVASQEQLTDGDYSVRIIDGNGCVTFEEITLSSPPPLNSMISTSDETGENLNDGTAMVDANGGLEPYTYVWSNGATTASISNLSPGEYSVDVFDSNGCSTTHQFIINGIDCSAEIDAAIDPINCFDSNDGLITLVSEIEFETIVWNNGEETASISNLAPGTYTATITLVNGCEKIESYLIEAPEEIIINETTSDVNCQGESDGAIALEVTGGNGNNYTYTWADGETGAERSNLEAGTYQLTVSDENNCTSVQSIEITEPEALAVASSTATDVSCFGESDGAVCVFIEGGISPYSFQWIGLDESTSKVTDLPSGEYNLEVIDQNNCFINMSLTVDQPELITLDLTTSDISADGLEDGTAQAMVSGGVPPYTYLWSNGMTTAQVNNLPADNYSVDIRDSNECSLSQTFLINGIDCTANISADIIQPSCFEDSDGQITVASDVNISSIDWSNEANGNPLSNLAQGAYTATITLENGCTKIENFNLQSPSEIEINTSIENTSCHNADDGSILIEASGGTGNNYTYAWQDGNNNANRTNLAPGEYTLSVTDMNNCLQVETYFIEAPTEINISQSSTNASCFENEDGTIQIEVEGGTGSSYTFIWEDGSTTANRSTLAAGTYRLTVTDENGCPASLEINISAPDILNVDNTSQDISCFGADDGAIDLSIVGGNEPYTIDWNTLNLNSASIANLPAGTYEVDITDDNGCISSATFVLTEPELLEASINKTDISGDGIDDGTAMATAQGGTPPYLYAWSNGATSSAIDMLAPGEYFLTVLDSNNCSFEESTVINGVNCNIAVSSDVQPVDCFESNTGAIELSSSSDIASILWSNEETGNRIENLVAGNYSATITFTNNCVTVESFTLEEPTPIVLESTIDNISCFGNTDGSISTQASGGTGQNYSYLWDDGSTEADNNQLEAGTYQLSVTDENNCLLTFEFTLSQPDNLLATPGMVSNVSCFGEADGAITLDVQGGTSPYVFDWLSSNDSTASIDNLSAGLYELLITDDNNCTNLVSVTISQPDSLVVSLINIEIEEDNAGLIEILVEGGTSPYTITWFNENMEEVGIGNLIENLPSGNYFAEILDRNNCAVSSEEYNLIFTSIVEVDQGTFILSPNPAKSSLRLQSSFVLSESAQFDIFDAAGKAIAHQTSTTPSQALEYLFEIEHLAAGTYYLRISEGGEPLTTLPFIVVE